MSAPLFYIPDYDPQQKNIVLDEDTSRHVIQVLRMKVGETINLTDGKGSLLSTTIADDHKKHCSVSIAAVRYQQPSERKIVIAISLLKNVSRFEWFLEKVTEMGVTEIIPLICTRTEKEKFRHERLQGILVSALLQSQQSWLPILHEPIAYELLFKQEDVAPIAQKFVAHCVEGEKQSLVSQLDKFSSSQIILIGPEGDFTETEINQAIGSGFIPVSLGDTRLRAETAGMVAAALLVNC